MEAIKHSIKRKYSHEISPFLHETFGECYTEMACLILEKNLCIFGIPKEITFTFNGKTPNQYIVRFKDKIIGHALHKSEFDGEFYTFILNFNPLK